MTRAPIALHVEAVWEDGFGTSIAHAQSGGAWVAATTNVANLWQGTDLVHVVPVNGYVGGRARFSADASSLALGVYVIDVESGEADRRVGDGLWLTAAIDDGSVAPSDFTTPFVVHVPGSELSVVRTEYQLPRGRDTSSAYSGPRAQLLLVDLDAGSLVSELVHDASDHHRLLDASADTIAAAAGRRVAVWGTSGEPLGEWTGEALVDALAVSSGGLIATLSRDGDATIRTADGDLRWTWRAHSGTGAAVAWAPSATWLTTASDDGEVAVWDLTGEHPERIGGWSGESVAGLGVTPDAASLIVASDIVDQTLTQLSLGR